MLFGKNNCHSDKNSSKCLKPRLTDKWFYVFLNSQYWTFSLTCE